MSEKWALGLLFLFARMCDGGWVLKFATDGRRWTLIAGFMRGRHGCLGFMIGWGMRGFDFYIKRPKDGGGRHLGALAKMVHSVWIWRNFTFFVEKCVYSAIGECFIRFKIRRNAQWHFFIYSILNSPTRMLCALILLSQFYLCGLKSRNPHHQ